MEAAEFILLEETYLEKRRTAVQNTECNRDYLHYLIQMMKRPLRHHKEILVARYTEYKIHGCSAQRKKLDPFVLFGYAIETVARDFPSSSLRSKSMLICVFS